MKRLITSEPFLISSGGVDCRQFLSPLLTNSSELKHTYSGSPTEALKQTPPICRDQPCFAASAVMSMAFAILPDSCLYVVMMAVLIPVIGKDGIWLSVTGNQVVGLMLLIPIVLLVAAVTGKRKDRLLLLPEEFYSGKLLLEFEISGDRMDMTEELEELRAPLEEVLLDSDRANGVMRCVEEIVSDMRRNSNYIVASYLEKRNFGNRHLTTMSFNRSSFLIKYDEGGAV